MNGWKRLWVFASLIWATFVIAIAAFMVKDYYVGPDDGPWIIYRLSDDSRAFYENIDKGVENC